MRWACIPTLLAVSALCAHAAATGVQYDAQPGNTQAAEALYDACESLEVSEKCGVRKRGVSPTAGISGGGYHVDGKDELLFPMTARPGSKPYSTTEWKPWSPSRGAVAFSYRPDLDFFSNPKSVLAAVAQGIRKTMDASLVCLYATREQASVIVRAVILDAAGRALDGGESTLTWPLRDPGWHRFVLAWDLDRRYIAFTVDGIGPERPPPMAPLADPAGIAVLGPDVSIGSLYGTLSAPGTYDEVRIYNVPVSVSAFADGPVSAEGLFAGRLLNDALEDRIWSAYQGGRADGDFVSGAFGMGMKVERPALATEPGKGLLYSARVPDDATRGEFQSVLFERGEIGFFIRPAAGAGTFLSIPALTASVDEEGRIVIEPPGTRLTGPPLPTDKWTHVSISFDRDKKAAGLKLDGRQVPLSGPVDGWNPAASIDPFIRFGPTPNDPVADRKTISFDLDEVYVYDSPRVTCPESRGVTFYCTFERAGMFADFARGRIEALGRPTAASGKFGLGFHAGPKSLLRFPYHGFYRVGKPAITTVNASLEKGAVTMFIRPNAVPETARRMILYLRAAGWGGDTVAVYLEQGRIVFRAGQTGTLEAPAQALTANEWHFLGASWDTSSGRLILCLDGAVLDEKTFHARGHVPASELPYTAWWAVGSGESAEAPFLGTFDEITVFSEPLDAAALNGIQEAYGKPNPGYPWEALP